jgi:hypothetical protein
VAQTISVPRRRVGCLCSETDFTQGKKWFEIKQLPLHRRISVIHRKHRRQKKVVLGASKGSW